jgi:hypothetical protein
MEKKPFLDTELTKNERKTITAFIEFEHGCPKLVKKHLRDICKKTKIINENKRNYRIEKQEKRKSQNETDKGYQSSILNKLKEKRIVDKDEDGFFLNPKYLDIAYSSMIQDQIKNLENKGLFRLYFTVFGIKKEWWKYPEIQHFYDAIFDSLCSLYRIKQSKAFFLIRDFNKQWKKFLDSDIHPAVKYWFWKIICPRLYTFCDKTADERIIDESFKILNFFNNVGNKEIKKYKNLIKTQHDDYIKEIRKDLGYEERIPKIKTDDIYPYPLGKKIAKKMKQYNISYQNNIIDYMLDNLTTKQKEMMYDIFEWTFFTYPNEVNNIGVYADISCLSGHIVSEHMNIDIDTEEESFRKDWDKISLGRINNVLKDLNEKTIDSTLQRIFDIYNMRNHSRFFNRLGNVILNQIRKPKHVKFSYPETEKLRNEIINLAKKDKTLRASAWLYKKSFETNEDIFTFAEYEFTPNLFFLLPHIKN